MNAAKRVRVLKCQLHTEKMHRTARVDHKLWPCLDESRRILPLERSVSLAVTVGLVHTSDLCEVSSTQQPWPTAEGSHTLLMPGCDLSLSEGTPCPGTSESFNSFNHFQSGQLSTVFSVLPSSSLQQQATQLMLYTRLHSLQFIYSRTDFICLFLSFRKH